MNNTPERQPERIGSVELTTDEMTALLDVPKDRIDLEPVRAIAEEKDLNEKEEFHFTIMGSEIGSAILEIIADMDDEAKNMVIAKIEDLIDSTDWNFTLKPQYFYIEKEKEPGDHRRSIVQLADLPGMIDFYDKLNKLLDTNFDVPFPHVTLFTTSTKEEKRLRGIAIYSRDDFEGLDPEQLSV